MDSPPPRKKAKFEPGIISGAQSASALAKGENSEEAFDIKEAPLLHFFPNPPQGQKDGETLLAAILREAHLKDVAKYTMTVQRLALNGNQYRNSVYRQLTAADKYNLKTVKGTSKWQTYHEFDLIQLFEAFVEANDDHICTEESNEIKDQLNREEHGTTTSKPDLSFIRFVPGFGIQFVFGVLKHASDFTKRIAQQQAALYLQGFLFFLRVKLGLPIKAIYGFALCGAKCSGFESKTLDPKYAVGLIKMTAPDSLQGEFVVESHWEHFGAFDSSGLKLLIHFLKGGNSYEFYRTQEQQQPAQKANVWGLRRPLRMRCPSLFTIPPSLWDDTNERKLVVNGTLAAVFRVFSINAAKQLLDNIVPEDESNPVQQGVGRAFRTLLDQLQFEPPYIYVKIHTTETIKKLDTSTFQRIWTFLKRGDHSLAISDFLQTYPVQPPNLTKCSFIVMNNRGDPLLSVDDLATIYTNFSGASPFLSALKAEVEELGECCFHADMLPHNVSVDATTRKLTLFDYDEARQVDDTTVPRRLFPDKSNVKRRLSYPNVLRKKQKTEYSIIQFSLIVRFVAETLPCSDSQQKLLGNLTSCHKRLADLVDIDDTKGTISQETVDAILLQVKDLVNHVDALLRDGSGEE